MFGDVLSTSPFLSKNKITVRLDTCKFFIRIYYMKEIEIKAHVRNRNELIKELNDYAVFTCTLSKEDFYWGKKKQDGINPRKIRIRKQTITDSKGNTKNEILLTYKQKKLVIPANSENPVEVNDEKETLMESSLPLETFLSDCGFEVMLNKKKETLSWHKFIEKMKLEANIELCNVPPLGDFLEVEILSPNPEPEAIDAAHAALEKIFQDLHISKDDIENRYYSELLAELN